MESTDLPPGRSSLPGACLWEEGRTSVRAGRPRSGGRTLPVAGPEAAVLGQEMSPEVGRTWRQEVPFDSL